MAVRTKAAVLAGDIGGTKTLLGLYRVEGGAPALLREKLYATRDFKTLEEVASDFLSGAWAIDAACFGVPGTDHRRRQSRNQRSVDDGRAGAGARARRARRATDQ